MNLDTKIECPLPPLPQHILKHVTERHLRDIERGEKDKITHNPQKAAEAIEIVRSLREDISNLKKVKEIGVRWEDKEDKPIFNPEGHQIPQAIFLLVELADGSKTILVVGPDPRNITHGSSFKAHKSGLTRQQITLINQQEDPQNYEAYARLANRYLESPTSHGTPFYKDPGSTSRELFVCPLLEICNQKTCRKIVA